MARKRRKRLSKATILGALLVTLVLCSTLLYKQNVMQANGKEYAEQLKELEKKSRELKKEKEELKDFKDYVKTDEYVEEVAREKFGLVYKDEIIFEPEDEK